MSNRSRLRLIPLGGLGEVGMNCLVLEHDEQLLVIDCGTNFPADDYGVDVVHPDFSWLRERWARVSGVFLTHGHEDHIGGLPYLVGASPCPIWGPAHALRLVQRRFAEHGIVPEADQLREVQVREVRRVGGFEIEPIRVSHSIVEATALAIRCEAGTLVHSGDFKFDPAPSDGEPTDEARLREIGDAGVDLLTSDSTNVDASGASGSEADVAAGLDAIIKGAPRRVFVALFASNVQRLISLGRIAQRRGRRLCLLGRSLETHVEVAQQLGYLDWPRDLCVPLERARSYPKDELLLLATGTQAEPAAALARLARGEHRWMDVEEGDTVVLSSRIIPGCDRAVVDMMGQLLRLGARVESRWTAEVHASGHACRDEQRRLIELVRPKAFVPVHGTLHHLRRHADLAREAGVPEVEVIENGQTLWLEAGRLRRGEELPTGKVQVAIGGGVLPPQVIDRRRELGRAGLVSIACICDATGHLREPPTVQAVGLTHLDRSEVREQLAEQIALHWASILCDGGMPLSRRAFSGGRGGEASERNGGDRNGFDRSASFGLRFVSVQTEPVAMRLERFVQRWTDATFGARPLVVVHVSRNPGAL